MRKLIGHVKVYLAYLTNNKRGKQEDVHGRKYRDIYKRFGHALMLDDYLHGNSWNVR